MYTMSIHLQTKLNQLQQLLPEGLLVDSAWLQSHGYSRQLIAKYVRNGWLQSPARSAYRRSGAVIDSRALQQWELVVLSLQQLSNLPVTPGGRTALELQGYSHYLSVGGTQEVHLYTARDLPGWVYQLPLPEKLIIHRTRLFEGNASSEFEVLSSGKAGKLKHRNEQIHYTSKPWGTWNWPLIMSMPERAVLELLAEIPQRETFDQADVLMQGLTTLSPKRLNTLLADCRSIKVKRLFMWFAERHNHAWFSRLDKSRINLGAGKREIVPGGKLDKKYLITVPRDLTIDG
jgi:hypothetical protein